MVHRKQEGEEAQRWKRKFLDALEDHEQREKALSNRIRLLRRGLLGVSLAGDGSDPALDKQLTELRKALRNDDRETGLELLLEQIEKSIIRLDNEKNASSWALKQAFESSLGELEQVSLPSATRRQIKKFSRSLSVRLEDPQQHAGLIRQFVELLSQAVRELKEQTLDAQNTQQAANGGGLWHRLFGSSAAQQASEENPPVDSAAQSAERTSDRASVYEQQRAHERSHESASEQEPHPSSTDEIRQTPEAEEIEVFTAESEPEPEADAEQEADSARYSVSLEPETGDTDYQEFQPSEPSDVEIEGELLRDRSGLQEPAFSFIAGHVEPLLLRILESIHITGESVQLAEAIRRHIVKGLNWYDFVAVLEEILQILRNAADEQRVEFQDFLSDVTESLAQVQAFVENAKKHADENSAADARLDAHVRDQISGISAAVADPDADLDTLKESVQSQIGAIISSLDGFRQQRQDQGDGLAGEMRILVQRISALENESRELRLHLQQQKENAHRDALTELPNRDAYNQRLRDVLESWHQGPALARRDHDRALCLAVADVDHFKNINDTYGHLAGDKVLKIISKELVTRLRDNDFVARYGGEEFVIIMPDTRPADAEHALNKLRQSIANIPFHFKEQHLQITVSFGVVDAVAGDTPESLFERADRALYKAKEEGRNRVHRARE